MVVTLGQQYNVGEKPAVVLYTYVNLHAGTPNKTKTKGHDDELGLQLLLITLGLGSNEWVSIKEIIFKSWIEMIVGNCPITIPTVCTLCVCVCVCNVK